VTLERARVGDRLPPISLRVSGADRVLVTGPNGAGKSTLLSAIAGSLSIDAGRRVARRGLRVGLLEQDVRFAAAGAARLASSTRGRRCAITDCP